MSGFLPIDRDVDFLLPPSVQEWLPEGHLARYVVEVVESLNLSELERAYAGRGSAAYHPAMLLSLLIFGYATGCFSSRKIERATYDSLAFRFIACNRHPDHDTLCTFRRRFAPQFEALFVQVLHLARENQLSSFGTVSLDGTKIHANASRHSALSYGHAEALEAQLKAEVQELLALAEQADGANLPEGMSLPEELTRREQRLEAIAKAKVKIEARAAERYERERAEYEAKIGAREAKAALSGKKPGGKAPKAPTPGPRPKDQVNLTDEDSRIMPVSGGGFEQCYNAQALVDTETLLVLMPEVVQAPNDKGQVVPMLEKLAALPEELERPQHLLADTGYCSAANVAACEAAGIEPYIAIAREGHHPHWSERFGEPPTGPSEPPAGPSEPPAATPDAALNPPEMSATVGEPPAPRPEASAEASATAPEAPAATPQTTPMERMLERGKTRAGRALYALRKQSVEPVFGIIKNAMGFRQFLTRGLANVRNEWTLVCLAWNLRRMAVLRPQ